MDLSGLIYGLKPLRNKVLVLLLSFILFFSLPEVGLAQAPTLETDIEVDFPHTIIFKLKAESPVSITKVILRFMVERIACFEEIIERHPSFTPGEVVRTSWTWKMKKVGGLPPGTRINYWWIIEDAQGKRWESLPKTFSFDDPRFIWKSISQDKIKIFWYRGDRGFAESLLKAGLTALNRLSEDIGVKLEREVRFYIYDSAEAMRGARIFPREWEGGVAFPDYGIVVIGIGPGDLWWGERAIAHELAHLVVFQATFNCYGSLPVWLNEGLAMYAEGELPIHMKNHLDKAIKENKLFTVAALSAPFPSDPDEAHLSYAQSYSIVEFLIRNFGKEKMAELLRTFKAGSGYDEALLKVYGFDMDGLDKRWREYVKAPPRKVPTPVLPIPEITPVPQPVPVASPWGWVGRWGIMFLAIIVVLGVGLGFILRRRNV